MKKICCVLFIIILLSISGSEIVFSAEKNISVNNPEFQKLKDNVSEIRRDQLNYKIEKDLLRETFSSNYQTINVVLAIVLGIFTIIGVLGIRDISTIRKDYLKEFDNLSNLRKDFEFEVKKFMDEQEKIKENYLQIIKTNEEQSKRIKVLELQEKISAAIKDSNYKQALEYVKIALELDHKNTGVLLKKASCFWKLNDLPKTVAVYKKILDLESDNPTAIVNSLELYLILKQFENFNALHEKHKLLIDSKGGETGLKTYYKILEFYQLKKYDELKAFFKGFLQALPQGKQKLFNWDFSDLLKFIQSKPIDDGKKLIDIYISVAKGELSSEEALTKIN
ncbi:MAG: hypothetical protein WC855_06035 [Thermodesulfovibrionales bacterium]